MRIFSLKKPKLEKNDNKINSKDTQSDDGDLAIFPSDIKNLFIECLDLDSLLHLCQVNKSFRNRVMKHKFFINFMNLYSPFGKVMLSRNPVVKEIFSRYKNVFTLGLEENLSSVILSKINISLFFSFIKDANIEQVENFLNRYPNLPFLVTLLENASGVSLLDCLNNANNQKIFDLFYRKILSSSIYRSVSGELDYTSIDSNGNTLLHLAVRFHQPVDVIVDLIDKGCAMDKLNFCGDSLLHLVAVSGSADVADILLSKKQIDVNLENGYWKTAVFLSVLHNNLAVLKSLKEAGAKLFFLRDDGDTLYHLACREGYVKIMDYLIDIKHKDDIFDINRENESPMYLALKFSLNSASSGMQGLEQMTFFDHLCQKMSLERSAVGIKLLPFLISAADVVAIKFLNADVIAHLQSGSVIEVINAPKKSWFKLPVSQAVEKCCEILSYLFEVVKINVDQQYGQGRQTALHEAIIQGSLLGLVDNKIVSTILEFTPSLAIKNNKGLTPLALADSYHSHAGNAKYLIEQHQEALNNSNAQSPGMKH